MKLLFGKMTYLRRMRCGKRTSPTFLRQLIDVSGLRGTLLLALGTLAAILNGLALVYRTTLMVTFYNDYTGWIQSINLDGSNLTDYSKSLGNTYAGTGYSTFDDVAQSATSTANTAFIVGAVAVVASFFHFFLWECVNTANVEMLRHIFFTQALRQDMAWHDQLKKESDLNSRLSVDLERVRNNLGSKTSMLIFSVTCILTALVVMLRMHWIFGIITLIGIIITIIFILISGKLLVKQVKKEQENERKIGYAATEVLTTFKIVKSFAKESHEVEKFSRLLKTGRQFSKIKHIICSIHSAFNIFWLYSLITAFLCVGALLIDERAISPGYYYAAIFCVIISTLFSGNLVTIMSDFVEGAASFLNLTSLKDVVPDIDHTSSDGSRPEHLKNDIYFQNVIFSYPRRKKFKVLNGLTMRVPKGKCVALVGPSGSGKSTIIDLLLRLLDPDSGMITLGEINIKTINVDYLRSRIGIVMQEPVLFDTTIEENIRYGNLAASSADIRKASELAGAHDFIAALPNGYKTIVGERGSKLSGGQKQRVAIARALVRDPDILLLDEATSALDSQSERVVQDSLERAMQGRTTVVVAHRLSTISRADLIYVLKDGSVHEYGTHTNLMLKLGVYYSMQSQESLRKTVEDPEIKCSTDENTSALEVCKSSGNQKIPEETGSEVHYEAQARSVPRKEILAMFLHWKSALSLIFSMIAASHCPGFCFLYYYRILQCFKKPLHEGSTDLYLNGLNMIYFDVGITMVFFIAILSASIAMEDTVEYLRSGMFRQVLSGDMHFFERTKSKVTQLANAIIQKPGQLTKIAGSKASNAVTGISQISASLIACFIAFWQLTMFQCLILIFILIVICVQMKLKLKLQRSAEYRLKKGSKLASECFDNIKTVHCLSIQKEMSASYKAIFTAPKEDLIDNLMYAAAYALMSCAPYFFLGMTLELGFKLLNDKISSIDALLCSTYNFYVAFGSATVLVIFYQDFGLSKQSVLDSIALAHSCPSKDLESSEKPALKGGIEFTDVHFSYPSSSKCPVLRGFSLTVRPGDTVALVGSSGHGKTTVINMLEKFYLADRGKIIIDGTDIRNINTSYLRENMALVTQEPLLFNLTIRENILYGAKSGSQISDETLFKCCQEANIYDFIMGLPERFETVVGARGSQLSGGQRQRIAIARALIRDPKILLLDEATSALDSESEKEVLEALDNVAQGRTTIVVAHRLSTIRNADLIAVVENGTVQEKGSHEELVKLKGRYYEMLGMN